MLINIIKLNFLNLRDIELITVAGSEYHKRSPSISNLLGSEVINPTRDHICIFHNR